MLGVDLKLNPIRSLVSDFRLSNSALSDFSAQPGVGLNWYKIHYRVISELVECRGNTCTFTMKVFDLTSG